ncbi:MAG: ATP-binding protein [Deltaproteobacteria bacterium]|nr:ATP-binding protein [Deltaproteobacteria bacterium]
MDIHIDVPAVRYRDLKKTHSGESSAVIKGRIENARFRQEKRFRGLETLCNARMSDKQIRQFCVIDDESQRLLEMAIDKLGLSARAYSRILKVARTIADLGDNEQIFAAHVAEAIQYRNLDRRMI